MKESLGITAVIVFIFMCVMSHYIRIAAIICAIIWGIYFLLIYINSDTGDTEYPPKDFEEADAKIKKSEKQLKWLGIITFIIIEIGVAMYFFDTDETLINGPKDKIEHINMDY